MTDNDLIKLFLPIINSQLTNNNFKNVVVKQANQPTQQGIELAPTVYFSKIGNRRYGFLGRKDIWDSVNSEMVHTETQWYETSFQISALVLQNVHNTNTYTASDLVNEVASIMQSDYARNILMASNVGILRVTNVTNPYFVDDRDQFEASPSFEFTLTYKQDRVSTNPVIEAFDYVINRV